MSCLLALLCSVLVIPISLIKESIMSELAIEILEMLQSGQSFKQVVDHLVLNYFMDEHYASNCVFAVKLQEGL